LEKAAFPEKAPQSYLPTEPQLNARLPREPAQVDPAYTPKFGVLDIRAARKERVMATARQAYEADHAAWQKAAADATARAQAEYAALHQTWEAQCEKMRREHAQSMAAWKVRKETFEEKQRAQNQAIQEQRKRYLSHEPDAIRDYCDMVLANSEYPESFPQEWDLEFKADSGILVVEYTLPAPEDLPALKEVKYVRARDDFEEIELADAARSKLYESVIYQVTLRTIHELFEADVVEVLGAIVFNGFVDTVDKGTGKSIRPCIVSLQASREPFLAINLGSIEPKACFRSLKGVAAAKLHAVAPVPPILTIDRTDRRFIEARQVLDGVHEGDNLGAMGWEDFEHLIREVFEKEFSANGGEVKITQASRDGGVDAVAFDPDPIRGGKIVIQAKRYTHTVGVSAVRDLYGTLLNEGANKGILVTTADYGPDAYEFAKGKPLTLLNGGHLLHLLGKHGYKARIDLKEAREQLGLDTHGNREV
ncbi:MAG: restriction endonuclease, partial [Halobacteriales archaeon]|nr:restriction endonuclease [Halobacteriales archaeon]